MKLVIDFLFSLYPFSFDFTIFFIVTLKSCNGEMESVDTRISLSVSGIPIEKKNGSRQRNLEIDIADIDLKLLLIGYDTMIRSGALI